MNMKPVTSSNIAAVGYDVATKQLRVQFLNGGTYNYDGVPQETHAQMMASASAGKFLHSHIKGVYAHSVRQG